MSKENHEIPKADPHEPLILRFVSTITGNVYDELTVDHLADVLLVFYAAAGTAIGAVLGGTLGSFLLKRPVSFFSILIVPALGLLGGFTGALTVLWSLNFLGLLRWDRYEIKRTYRLKPNASPVGNQANMHNTR